MQELRGVRAVSISDSNLMASRYPSRDLPIPISRYRPPFDDDGFRLATARRGSRDLRTLQATLLAIRMVLERDSTPGLGNFKVDCVFEIRESFGTLNTSVFGVAEFST